MTTAAAPRIENQTLRELKDLRVLIVEDHLELARMFSTLLRANGCDVIACEKGLQAIACAKFFRPEAILLDIRLPDIDGYEVARQILEKAKPPRPLIIAISAYSQDRYREQAEAAGMDLYVTKPVGGTALMKYIRETPIKEQK